MNDGQATVSKYDFTGVADWDRIVGWFDLPKAILMQQAVKSLAPGSVLIELGSFQGRSSVALAAVLPPNSVLYCVDHFRGSEEHKQMNIDTSNLLGAFQENLIKFGVKEKIKTLVMSTTEALGHFSPASLDLVFLDAAHDYESVRRDLLDWYPKLKPGGYLFCDDCHTNWPGVMQAIQSVNLPGQIVVPALWFHQKPK